MPKMPEIQKLKDYCLFTCVFLFFAFSNAFAQQLTYLPYHTPDSSKLILLAGEHKRTLIEALVTPEGVNKKYRQDFEAIRSGVSESSYYTLRYNALIDTVIDPYVQGIFQQLLETNKHLPSARLVLLKSPIENAYALADGTVMLNVGLLSKLENESQLAYVLCHELAHVYFKHVQKGLLEYLDLKHDKALQKEYKKIVKEEYNMIARLTSLMQNASLNNLYHKRSYEQQADSLGYLMLRRSGFDASQAYTTLQLLDKVDEPFSQDEVALSKYFGCENNYNIFDSKPKSAGSIFAVQKEAPSAFAISDTLKTHPDCKKRMLYIEQLAKANPALPARPSSKISRFQYIKTVSRLEAIQSWYDAGRYDRSLFETLLNLEAHPDNAYLRSMLMLNLFELKEHLQAHRYYEVVARRSENYPPNLNSLLDFLHNLNLSDFQGLGSCLNGLYPADATAGEYSQAARYAHAVLIKDEAAAAKQMKIFKETYPKGRLSMSLFK